MTSDSLLEALNKPDNGNYPATCKFSQIRENLSDDEKAALDKAVNGIRDEAGVGKAKTYSTAWLTKVLKNFGYSLSVSTTQRHVNKECSCERFGK
jgi:hypothetical protein